MLHAAVLRSPVAHGRVRSLDLEAALAVPGVRAVIGPESELSLTRAAPLLAAEPGYAGQPIAVVAADTLEAAREGVRALALDIEVLGHIVDPREAVNEQHFIGEPSDDSRGDAEAALAAAEVTVEVSISTPPRSCRRRSSLMPRSHRGTATSSPPGCRRRECSPPARSSRRRSGCARTTSGCRPSSSAAASAASRARASRRSPQPSWRGITGRPVRLVNDRHGEQLDGGRRVATQQTYRLGATRDGTLTAIEAEAVVGMGQGGWAMPAAHPGAHALPLRRRRALLVPRRAPTCGP